MKYTHVLKNGVLGVKSPADFLATNDFTKNNNPLAALPSNLEQRLWQVVDNSYQGNLEAAISALLQLHEKS